MKKILSIMLCMVLLFSACPVSDVHAEDTKTYSIHAERDVVGNIWTYSNTFHVPATYEVYAYWWTEAGINFVLVHDEPTTTIDLDCNAWYIETDNVQDYKNVTVFNRADFIERSHRTDGAVDASFGVIYCDVSLSMDPHIPLFSSFQALGSYLENGNTDGYLNKPVYDLSVKHDFNSDVWSPDIPVPELSKISHTGFTLENWTEEYYVDIIVDNHLSRIMMGKRYPSNDVIPLIIDSAPWYSEHYWNFTLHDAIPSRSVIDINEFFGVDIQGALIEDFKNWSIEHPTIKTVDRYSWTHIGLADEYLAKHVYKADSDLSDVQQLINSGQAITEFYVRYYTLDGKYSQWAHYKLRDFTYDNQGELVDVGRVTAGTINNNGKPSNTITGSTDSSGNIDYTPIVTTPSINTDMDFGEFLNLLETSSNVLQQFPLFLSQLFLFLPWWVNALIACAIAMCILLRIVGR